MHARRRLLRSEEGFAIFTVFLVLVLLLTLGSASLVNSTLDTKSTTHYLTGNQALFTAEAGLVHALGNVNRIGVLDFKADIADRWSTIFGNALTTMPDYPEVSYQVIVQADPADPVNRGSLTATGFAPAEARRVLRVGLKKSGFGGGQGAIYLAGDKVNSEFAGDAFEVDGNDYDVLGKKTNAAPMPGISTRNDGVTDGVVNSLNDSQKDNVQGLGFSLNPLTPSVKTTAGPSVDDLDQIVSHILSKPGVVTTNQNNFNGNDTFGTLATPQITHMTNSDVFLNGNAFGAGILIVDGSITINGTLDFIGWIIVRGDTVINVTGNPDDETDILGRATLRGSIWTGNLKIKVGGKAKVDYCDACLRLADGVAPPDNLIPRPMAVTSWAEVL